jgi:hypothetical protein
MTSPGKPGGAAAPVSAVTSVPSSRSSSWTGVLGAAGLLPFAAAVVMIGLDRDVPLAATTLLAYGAVILTFIGAVHWGWALRDAEPAAATLVASVLPSLVAWVTLLLPQATWGLALQVPAFALWHLWERSTDYLPPAYLTLRLRLTLCVMALQGIGLGLLLLR